MIFVQYYLLEQASWLKFNFANHHYSIWKIQSKAVVDADIVSVHFGIFIFKQ